MEGHTAYVSLCEQGSDTTSALPRRLHRVEQSPVCLLTLALCKGGRMAEPSVKWLFLCVLVLGFYFSFYAFDFVVFSYLRSHLVA